jgi:Porin subfamily
VSIIRTFLLGSAAALVVVAGAQAADLPTRKGAPAAEYVKVCKVGGAAGFVIPGSDTCLKITGYMTGQVEGGNLSQGYTFTPATTGSGQVGQTKYTPTATNARDAIGYTARAEVELIAKTNTAYGVLTSDIDTQFNYGSGFDSEDSDGAFINHGFVNWAGITAGKANSFFSFFAAGYGFADIFSPDRQGYNQPLLLAYTATFGGGFSATISLEDPKESGPSAGETIAGTDEFFAGNATYLGMRSPDIVASVDLAQGWGGAHLSGVAHNVIMQDDLFGNTLNTWGWAVDGGLKFNLPTIGAGDNIQFQGVWSRNAVWYSGISDGLWGENGAANGNGIAMPVADAFSNGNGTWATPTAWSLTAISEFHFGPAFSIDPEVSYAQLNWSGVNSGLISTDSQSWIVGGVGHWDPVAHLDFSLELLYQTTHQSAPEAFTTAGNAGIAWKTNTDGLESRLMITRDF